MSAKRVPTTDEALALARYWAGDEQPGDAAVVASYSEPWPALMRPRDLAGALARWALVAVPELRRLAAREAEWQAARDGWQAELEREVMRARRAEAQLALWAPVLDAAGIQTDGQGRPGMWRVYCGRTCEAVRQARARAGGEL